MSVNVINKCIVKKSELHKRMNMKTNKKTLLTEELLQE